MALQNRVTPLGELIAHPGRGLVYGNRGCLHDGTGRIRRAYAGRRWIACRLEFKGWRRGALLQPGRFTELFFLDEATAFAAGHRPCALCRREDYRRFQARWSELHGGTGADEMDSTLHEERLDHGTRTRRLHRMPYDRLPDGVFVVEEGAQFLVLGDALLRWSLAGYTAPVPRPSTGHATAITPPSLVAVLRRGWSSVLPLMHPTAQDGFDFRATPRPACTAAAG